jgi:hypothetical protein
MNLNNRFVFAVFLVLFISTVNGQSSFNRAGLVNRLIEIKYSSELYLIVNGKVENKKDTALAVYNLLRWKIDGLIYQLSADIISDNSPKRLKLLNKWCIVQPEILDLNDKFKKSRYTDQYVIQLNDIDTLYRKHIILFDLSKRSLNLTTNVFYLIKDSWSVIKGLSDMKTQKTMALVQILDQTRLSNPMDLLKLK